MGLGAEGRALFLSIDVSCTLQSAVSAPSSEYKQRAYVSNPNNTRWSLNPKAAGVYLPLGLAYLVVHCAEDYSATIVGAPGVVRGV